MGSTPYLLIFSSLYKNDENFTRQNIPGIWYVREKLLGKLNCMNWMVLFLQLQYSDAQQPGGGGGGGGGIKGR